MIINRKFQHSCLARPTRKILCLPLWRGGVCWFTCVRSVCPLSLCLCVLSVCSAFYHAGGQTWDVDQMLGWCWPTVYDAEPALAQYWATVSCLAPRWMIASVTDSGPTFNRHWIGVSLYFVDTPPPTESTVQYWMVDGQSRRRWTSNKPALGCCVVFAGHSVVGHLVADTGPLSYPANTGYSHNAVSMLALRLQRWPNWVNDPCLLGIGY